MPATRAHARKAAILTQGIGSWIHKRRVKPQDHTAIIEDGKSLSYAELAAQIDKLANVLGDLGVEKGVRVAYWATTTPRSFKIPRVEGQWKVQDGNTRDLIFSVPGIVSDLPQVVTLQPGDLIFTGTPAGVGMSYGIFLKPGDILTSILDGIETIRDQFA